MRSPQSRASKLGFVRGRHMESNVCELCAGLVEASVLAPWSSAATLLDFAAASQSFRHKWIHQVFAQIRLPRTIRRLADELYRDLRTELVFGE